MNGWRQIRLGWILVAVGVLLSAWLASQAVYQVMILSAGVAVVGLLLDRQRHDAAAGQLRERRSSRS